MIIRNAKVYKENGSFAKEDIYIEGARFVTENKQDNDILDAAGCYAIPGLTDLHFHGCAGYDFCDGTDEALRAIAEYEAQNGITSIAPATMTLGDTELERIFSCAASYHNENGADLVGIHMEGPYLSCAKKGAQDAVHLHKPEADHFRRMMKLSGNRIKLVSIAPEEEGALAFIDELKDEVILSLAHSTADYETACAAFTHGATHVTHLYNAMTPFHHREPGIIGAALDTSNCRVELICDGVHVDPCVIRATFRLFGDDRIILVSDSMMATGMKDGTYSLGGQSVTVQNHKAFLSDGTIAGSVSNLTKCMVSAVSFGIPLESAVKCAAVNPAKELGIYSEYGSITPGKYANLLLMDQNLNLKQVIQKGKRILFVH